MRVSTRTSRAYRAPALDGEPRFALPPHTPNCVVYGVHSSSGGGKPPHPRFVFKDINLKRPILYFLFIDEKTSGDSLVFEV